MLDGLVKVTRIGVVAFWFALFLSLISVIPNPYGRYIVWLAGLVLLIHLFQYFLVRSSFTEADAGKFSFFKTMLFGFTHWLPLLKHPGSAAD
jgi:uncharacterized protein YhhL (DUF1145 family)